MINNNPHKDMKMMAGQFNHKTSCAMKGTYAEYKKWQEEGE